MSSVRFSQEFLTKLEYLYVVSRKVFAGKMRGERRTKKVGAGVEFADHRNYTAGDDLRYLDWAVYGRLERLLIRLFEEEEDLHIYLLVDGSASMRQNGKLDYAVTVAAALAYIGLAKLDRVSVVPLGLDVDGRARPRLPPSRGRGNIWKVLGFLEALEGSGPTALVKSIEGFVHATKRRGLAVVLSDFYDLDGPAAALDLLRFHRFEPTVLQIWSAKEARPDLRGDVELVDAETGERRDVTITERALAAYMRAHAALTNDLAAYCASHGVGYFKADTNVPFDELLLRMLREGGFLS